MRPTLAWSLLCSALLASGCSLGDHYPEGRISCASSSECPRDWSCRASTVGDNGLCYRNASADAGTDTLDAQTTHDGAVVMDGRDSAIGEPDASEQARDAATRDADTVPVDAGPIAADAGALTPDASTGPVPTVEAVTVGNRYLNPTQQTPIRCLASDPTGGMLSYAWTTTLGQVAAPMQPSTQLIAGPVGPTDVSCRATNSKGGSASASGSVRVYPAGWLTLLRFSLDSTDLSGHSNDGVVVNGVYGSDRAGNTGAALQLDGTGSVTLSNVSTFELAEWSFVATLNPLPGHGGTIFSRGDTAFGSFAVFLYADNDKSLPGRLQYYQAATSGNYTDVLGSYSAKGNSFFQLAVTRSKSGELRAYVDGTLITSANNVPPSIPNDAPVLIGSGPLGGYAGVIDEVQFYNRALLATEVLALVAMQ